jgi:phage gpG-like protein
MAMVRSSFGALEDLRRRTGLIGSPQFRETVARRLATAAIKLMADEFRDSRDPYGRPWRPLRRRVGKPLLNTGRLRAAAGAFAQGATIRISIPVEYASYHQYGTRRIPQRQIVPTAATGGLGPIWLPVFRREIEGAIRDAAGVH